ncbi:MAG TPA: hypothetical protein VMW27_07120 [Thermoanaerobaculia bacterium]|nr:hypothetical protein [Thermoanaerobaculia bacterium]
MRDLEISRRRLLEIDERYRLNSSGDFFYPDRYLKLDNTELEPAAAARRIAEAFRLERTRA